MKFMTVGSVIGNGDFRKKTLNYAFYPRQLNFANSYHSRDKAMVSVHGLEYIHIGTRVRVRLYIQQRGLPYCLFSNEGNAKA